MSIQSSNIYDLLSPDNEGVLPSKVAKSSKVEAKAAPKGKSEPKAEEKKPAGDLGKGRKTEDRPKRSGDKPGGGASRPPRDQPANPNKRVYDRRSGTGRGRENKKGGAGRANWGSLQPKDELAAESAPIEGQEKEEEPKSEAAAEKPAETTEGAPASEAAADDKAAEEDDKSLSLDEWKKKNEVKVAALPPPRQAGEGVDDSAWAGFVPLTRELDEEQKAKKNASDKKSATKEGVNKVPLDQVFNIQPQFSGEPRGRRGRGGRGGRGGSREGGRGTRGGRGRGGRGQQNFQLNEDAFPSLSTKA